MPDRVPLHDYSHSRAVVVGTWEYENLQPVPAVGNSLKRMVSMLAGPLCGWPEDRILVMTNERGPGDIPDRLITVFEDVVDVALFYYAGHGQIDMNDQLCLGLVASRAEANRRAATSLPFEAVRRALLDSHARTKIVILDCCFAGLVSRPANTLAALADDVLDITSGAGAFTMTASGPYSTAWFETDPDVIRPETFFTKYLADLVESGIPGGESSLRLHSLFNRVRDNLARDKRPVPSARNVDGARDFAFAYNAAPPETHHVTDTQHQLLAQRPAEAEARSAQEHVETLAQQQALRAKINELTQELERLKDQARQNQSMAATPQGELQNAIREAGRRLDEATTAQGVNAERIRRASIKPIKPSSPPSGGWKINLARSLLILLMTLIFLLLGAGMSHSPKSLHLGPGNWLATVVTELVIFVLVSACTIGVAFANREGNASNAAMWAIPCYIFGFTLGFFLVPHIGLTNLDMSIRAWLAWRF